MKTRSLSIPAFLPLIALLLAYSCAAHAQSYSVSRSLAYQNAKDWQGLLNYATAWTKAEPNNIEAWGAMANAYIFGFHQPDKAIDPLKRCVTIQPNAAPAWHALGVAYTQNNQFGEGVDAIKHAIQINPNQPTYYNNLAAAYSGGAAWKSALSTLDQEKALAQRLNNAKVWYTLGNGYAKLGDLPNAIAAYRQVLQLNPNFAQGWTNLGAALQFNGDNSGAKDAYGRGQALGDPLAGKDAALLQAQEEQARRQVAIRPGMGNPNVSHMYDYYHDVSAGVDASRQY